MKRPQHDRDPEPSFTETESLGLDGGEPAPAGAAFQRGACLGRYIVLGAIGSGGMGNVYAAYDPELDRKVALKVIRTDLLLSEESDQAQSRLLREAQATAKLSHPNVVSVFDIGSVGERLFIAMELIEGVTLADWLAAGRPSWRQILRIFSAAGRGLAAAHREGLVHRDFKPGNVMVARDGRVQVVDFGLARAADQHPESADRTPGPGAGSDELDSPLDVPLTLTGKALGTPAYMAPEQDGGAAADARSDQFSYCVALYEALYRQLPFGGETVSQLRRQVRRGEVREPPADSPVPGWVRRVLLRGLAPRPAERFATMEDLLAALAKDPALRRRHWLAAAAALALGAALLVGWSFFPSRGDLLCQGAERKLAGIWDSERKAAIEAAFLAAGAGGHAEQIWSRVAGALDGYAGNWVAMHTEACEATHRRGEQSEEMLDRQMACLDSRLLELDALTTHLARGEGRVVETAVSALDSLSHLAGCADRRALTELEPPDSGEADRVNEIRAALAAAGVQQLTGQYREALAAAEAAARDAEALGYRPLLGEARFRLALIQGQLNRLPEMKSGLVDTACLAQQSHHREFLARAFTYLILADYLERDAEGASQWGKLAGAAIESLGERPKLESERLLFLGMVAQMEGDYELARDHYQACLDVHPEASKERLGSVLNNLGIIYQNLGQLPEALDFLNRALSIVQQTYGPQHPTVGFTLDSLGELSCEMGDFEAAVGHYRRSLEILDRVLPSHPMTASPLTGLGRALIELDQAGLAVAPLERAVEIAETGSPEPSVRAQSKYQLARALADSGGDRRRALRLAEEARQLLVELGDRAEGDLERVEAWLRQRGGRS